MPIPSKEELLQKVRSEIDAKYAEMAGKLRQEIEKLAQTYNKKLEKVKEKFIARIS